MISILVAEPNAKIRRVIVDDLIGNEPDITVIGEAGTGPEALRIVRELDPDVLVIDLDMPEQSGLEILTQIEEENRLTNVIFFSAHYSDTYILEAFRRGASGYVLKGLASDHLLKAIRIVSGGERVFYNDIIHHPLDEYLAKGREKHGLLFDSLTPREREVLFLITQALDRAAIADRLSISQRTVDKHIEHLYDKLPACTQAELMIFGFREGFVPFPQRNLA